MKSIAAMFCLTVLTLTLVRAQAPDDEKDQYLVWKKQISTTLQDYGHLFTFHIGIALRKTDNQ
jgi:hypothetical protein